MILIENGYIETMEGPAIECGYVILDGARIVQVGSMESLSRGGKSFSRVFDAAGGYVMPGIIDAHSHIGMWEDSLNFEGADGNEDTDPITPQLRAIDAMNPMDRAFREGLEAGVTTSVTGPGSANVIGGQFAAVKMAGSCVDDMVILAPAAMKIALGENPKGTYHEKSQLPTTRMGMAALLRETLEKARRYLEQQQRHEKDPEEEEEPEYDMKLQAILPLLRGEIPAKVHAHRADDILTAIRIGKEFHLSLSLEHATEGYLIPEKIKEYPVLIGPILCDRSKPELRNQTPAAGGILEKAGLHPVIISDHPETPVQYLLLSAAVAVREGMSRRGALEAVTIRAAQAVGLQERIGSIKPGKDADIVIFDGDPLLPMTRAQTVFVNGECVVEKGRKGI